MAVYNYVRARWSDGVGPVDDAPPAVLDAIEAWRAAQTLGESVGVDVCEVEEPKLSLLVLHGEAVHSPIAAEHDFVHIVAVSDRRLRSKSRRQVRKVFEALYGAGLETVVPEITNHHARLPRSMGAIEAVRYFASDADLASLRWDTWPGVAGSAHSRSAPRFRSRSVLRGLAIAALCAVTLGIGITGGARVAHWLEGARQNPLPSAGVSPVDVGAAVARLEQEVRGLNEEIASLRRDALRRGADLAQLEERLVVAEASGFAPTSLEDFDALNSVLPLVGAPDPLVAESESDAPDERRVERVTSSVGANRDAASDEAAQLPSVAAGPRALGPLYRVVVDTARVRADASSEGRTRGLLPFGTRVRGIAEQGDWVEIEPTKDLSAPAWIHLSLLEVE